MITAAGPGRSGHCDTADVTSSGHSVENERVPEERRELVYIDHMESLSSSALPLVEHTQECRKSGKEVSRILCS